MTDPTERGDTVNDHTCDTGNFDRTLCPEPCDKMHSFCSTCGERQDACAHDKADPTTAPTDDLAAWRDEVAGVLGEHDDPPGWMWSVSDQMVYACECGDHYVAGAIDVIQEHDVMAAAEWHRKHMADALVPLLERREREVKAAGRAEALGIAADLLGRVVDYWDGRPTEHHGHHIEADLRDVLRAIERDRDHNRADAITTEVTE